MPSRSRRGKSAPPAAAPVVATAPTDSRLPALTGLRGLAAFGVLCLHAFQMAGRPSDVPAPIAWLMGMGWAGVDVFFVLSAFLLALPFARAARGLGPAPDLRRYARRRVWRILPAYYVQIVFLLLLGVVGIGGTVAWTRFDLGSLAAHAVLWINAWPLVPAHLPPWWTLPVEMGFYLLLPWLAWALGPRRWPWLLVLVALSLAWRWGIDAADLSREQTVLWSDHLPGRLHQFVVGMLAAGWVAARQARGEAVAGTWAEPAAWLALAAFLALPALGFDSGDRAYNGAPTGDPLLLGWHLYAAVVVAIALVAIICGATRFARWLAAPPLRLLGVISYSLYLWHYPVLLALRESIGGPEAVARDFAGFVLAGAITSVFVATLSWWAVERPALRHAARD